MNMSFASSTAAVNNGGAPTRSGDTRSGTASQSAPPLGKECTCSAPLYKDLKTPIGLKNHESRPREESGSWGRKGRKPVLNDLRPDDLRRLSRLKHVYREAVKAGWLIDSDANFQNVVAAAVRATRVIGDPVRIFVSIIRRELWHHITIEQENRAREVIRRSSEAASKMPSRSSGLDRTLTPLSASPLLSELANQLPAELLAQR
jgi:hypothetical protein